MSETTTEKPETDVDTEATAEAETEAAETAETEKVDGEDDLGNKGKKALDTMKAERKAERDARLAAERERDELRAKIEGKEAEYAAEQEKRAAEQAALSKANDRIRRSEVKAAAKGVLADPADAYKFLDLESFEVDDDGNVDESAIADALADLVKSKPYLAAQGSRKFQGTADGGARNGSTQPSQLSEADVKRLAAEGRHDEIVKAKAEGRLTDYLAS